MKIRSSHSIEVPEKRNSQSSKKNTINFENSEKLITSYFLDSKLATTNEDKQIQKYIEDTLINKKQKLNEFAFHPSSIDVIKNIDVKNSSFDTELFLYSLEKENKTIIDYLFLTHCLKDYDAFSEILNKIDDDEERSFLFMKIIDSIQIRKKSSNLILFKLGDDSERFYFLLKGKCNKLNVVKYNVIMNKYEYYSYMKNLYYNGDENELFNYILRENEDKFDKLETLKFIINSNGLKFIPEGKVQSRYLESLYEKKIDALEKNANSNTKNNPKRKSSMCDRRASQVAIKYKKDMIKIDSILKNGYVLPFNKIDTLIYGNDETVNKLINVFEPEKYIDSLNEYLNALEPIILPRKNEIITNQENDNYKIIEDKNVALYKYQLNEFPIEQGMCLENLTLNDPIKRQFTVICETDCVFGIFSRKMFFKCVKEKQAKFHKNDITFLLKNELFSQLNAHTFNVKYFGFFESIKLKQEDFLLKQGEISNKVFFLLKGEVEVTMEANIYELYKIILLKGGRNNTFTKDSNYFKRFHSINIDKKIYEIKRHFKIFNVNENFPIGLEDFDDNSNSKINIFNVRCIIDCEILAINKQKLEEIVNREKKVQESKNKIILERNKLILERLEILRNNIFQKFINEQTNQPNHVFDFQKTSCCLDNTASYMNKTNIPSINSFKNLKKLRQFNYNLTAYKKANNTHNSYNGEYKSNNYIMNDKYNYSRGKKRLIKLNKRNININKIIESINKYKAEKLKNQINTISNNNQKSLKHFTTIFNRNSSDFKFTLKNSTENLDKNKDIENKNFKISSNRNLNIYNNLNNELKIIDPLETLYKRLKTQEMKKEKNLLSDTNKEEMVDFYGLTCFNLKKKDYFNNGSNSNRRFLIVTGNSIRKEIKEVKMTKNKFKDKLSVLLNKNNNKNKSVYDQKILNILHGYVNKNTKSNQNSKKSMIENGTNTRKLLKNKIKSFGK